MSGSCFGATVGSDGASDCPFCGASDSVDGARGSWDPVCDGCGGCADGGGAGGCWSAMMVCGCVGDQLEERKVTFKCRRYKEDPC